MKQATNTLLKRAARDEKGNVAILFGLMSIPLFGIMGIAIDYSRAIRMQSILQTTVDTAALSALSVYRQTGDEEKASLRLAAFVEERLSHKGLTLAGEGAEAGLGQVTLTNNTVNPTDSTAHPTLTSAIDTTLLALFGVDQLEVSASSLSAVAASSAQGTKDLELALMLDISSSMTGTKMTDMQAAAKDFLDIVMPDDLAVENRHVGLVPFAGKVNIGSRAYASAATGYAETRTTTQNTGNKIFSTTAKTWRQLSSCRTEVKKVHTSYSNNQAENLCKTYQSRVNNKKTEYNTPDAIDETTTVTQYLRTCVTERSGSEAYTDAAPGEGSYVGVASKTSAISSQYTASGECIIDGSVQSPVRPLSTDREAMKDHIDDMVITSGTAGHVGTAWSYYMLSPSWNSFWGADVHDVVDYNTEGTVKAAVLMTDGEYNSNYEDTSASAQAVAICEQMKANGIIVFTIGFDMSTNENDPARQTLVQCASPGKYYFPYTGEALREAFREIGNSLVTIVTISSDDTGVIIKE